MIDYAILGGGRLARHFSHYFHLLGIPHNHWVRDNSSQFNTFDLPDARLRLRETTRAAKRALVLVSDDAIGDFLKQYPFLHDKQLIHCSGSLAFPGVVGAHPLMTFADDLYDLKTYQSIPFILEEGQEFGSLFPGLGNPHHSISIQDKAHYHALCVMAGNFAQLLWGGVGERFEQNLGLPTEILYPYLEQVLVNFEQSPLTALTGPLARNDERTIGRNLDAISGDPMEDLYHAFVSYYQNDRKPCDIRERVS